MTFPAPQCWTCIHFKDTDKELVCDAFPEGIPEDIILNFFIHTKPYKGDHNIQYTPIKKK